MKAIFCLVMIIFSISAFAKRFQVQIDSVDEGINGKDHLILMSDGQVGFLSAEDSLSLMDLRTLSRDDKTFEIELDSKNKVLSMRSIAPEAVKEIELEKLRPLALMYDPTVVSSSEGRAAFYRMRRDYQNQSQCYNRAHIWAYEEFKKTGMKTMKVFMFFTSRYIRNYNYKWWFHVTPAAQTINGLRTMDRRYTGGLLTLKTWSNVFVKTHRTCPIVAKYNDYRYHQQTEDCYHIAVSMYFWQPRDISRRDQTGYEKTSFIQSEVNHAYWEAF